MSEFPRQKHLPEGRPILNGRLRWESHHVSLLAPESCQHFSPLFRKHECKAGAYAPIGCVIHLGGKVYFTSSGVEQLLLQSRGCEMATRTGRDLSRADSQRWIVLFRRQGV
ncbi:hypothetical protein Bbelb_136690 [Branchiostoma belcheri]|nr:hypothetical protein Bbelb_136690 [Branchiostoma belcheri]